MLKIVQARQFILLCVFALGVAACGKSADEPQGASPLTDSGGLLQYVPADTPYVFGTLAPPPDEFMDKMEPKVDRLLAAYSEMLRVAVAEAQSEDAAESEETEQVSAVVDELRSLMSLESLKEAGMTRRRRHNAHRSQGRRAVACRGSQWHPVSLRRRRGDARDHRHHR
jgi:hypothetical protein